MGLVIDKTAKILELVSEKEPCSLKELTVATGMKKPTLFLILKSMAEVGFLCKSADNRYSLGPLLFQLTRQRRNEERIGKLINTAAEQLAQEINEAVTVAAIAGTAYSRLVSVDSNQTVKVSNAVLEEMRFYRNATGRILLAYSDAALVKSIVDNMGLPRPEEWDGVDSLSKLTAELQKIRAEGIAIKSSQDGQAVFIAAPVSGTADGRPLSVGVSIPAFRFTGKHKENVIAALVTVARNLSSALA